MKSTQKIQIKKNLRHRTGEVDARQVGWGGNRVPEHRPIRRHKVDNPIGYASLAHDVENAPIG